MRNLIFILFVLSFINTYGQRAVKLQQPKDLTTLRYSVEEAPEWTELLKRSLGWFGGDGIFTIPLNGKEHKQASNADKVLFLFSDSMIGEINDGALKPGYKMIHNSVAVLEGNEPEKKKMVFYWGRDKKNVPETVFIPNTPNTDAGDYYWLGDGFVNRELNNNLYIFGYRIKNVSDAAFGFKEVGNTLIKISANSKPPYKDSKQRDTPFFIDGNGTSGSFGAGIYVNTKAAGAPAPDGYIYVYGVIGKWKELMVARVPSKDFENYNKWTYWDGNEWAGNIKEAKKIADWVSNELSVSPMPDGRYALIFQIGTMSKDIGLRIGKTPYGPFGPAIKIWDCSKDLLKKTYTVYNAKAHPSLSKPGELIISYNINSVNFFKDLPQDPDFYRPRFIRLKFN
jgi:hypothetical protein